MEGRREGGRDTEEKGRESGISNMRLSDHTLSRRAEGKVEKKEKQKVRGEKGRGKERRITGKKIICSSTITPGTPVA